MLQVREAKEEEGNYGMKNLILYVIIYKTKKL